MKSLIIAAILVSGSSVASTVRGDDERSNDSKAEQAWQTDLSALDAYLKQLTEEARTPTEQEFKARFKNTPRDLTVITDGGGGVVDFNPGVDTVQFRVNEALKGRSVRWEFELGTDVAPYGQPGILSKHFANTFEKAEAANQWDKVPFLSAILITRHQANLPTAKLSKGQRIIIQGKIGDAAKNRDDRDTFHGATAIYYLEQLHHPIFWIALDRVTITRVSPTGKQLAVLLLSDKPNMDRSRWKVLETNDRTKLDQTLVRKTFDGAPETTWFADVINKGQPQSILVDLGAAKTVCGMRFMPPKGDKKKGTVGEFSLYVSNSPETMGEPVATGEFIDDKVEQEVGFREVSGRYFRLVPHPLREDFPVAIAELNLLEPAVAIPDLEVSTGLPPIAEAIEKFTLLRQLFDEPPIPLKLTPKQSVNWQVINDEFKQLWYHRNQKPALGLFWKVQWLAVNRVAAKANHSPLDEANFYAVAMEPKLSTDEQRTEMSQIADEMKKTRIAYLSAIKRMLSSSQQAKLKQIITSARLKPDRSGEQSTSLKVTPARRIRERIIVPTTSNSSFVVFAILSSLCVTTSQAQQSSPEVPKWGRFEDPSGQAKLKVEASAVEITSGKNEMTAKDTLGKMPRIVRQANGDFDVRVRVSGDFTAEYQTGVLLAFVNQDEYVRMKCGSGRYRAKEVATGFRTRSVITGGRFHRVKETSNWLRMQRVGNEVRTFYSHDGKRWHASANSKDIKFKDGGGTTFPQPMQLMLLVHNRDKKPLTVRFEAFEITEGKGIEPVAVVDNLNDPIAKLMKRIRTPIPPPVPEKPGNTANNDQYEEGDDSWESHEQLAEQTLDALAEMIDAIESVLGSDSEVTQQKIQALSKRAENLGKRIKQLPPQLHEQRLALLERVDEYHQQLQRRIQKHQQQIEQLAKKDPKKKGDQAVEQKRRQQLGLVWGGLTGLRTLAFRAGLPFTEEKAVLVNPQRVFVTPGGEIAIEMVLYRFRAEPNTPIYGGKDGHRLNPRHQLIERKTRFLTASREIVVALIQSLGDSASLKITRVPFAQASFVDPEQESQFWKLVTSNLLAPTTTRKDLPDVFKDAPEYQPDSVRYEHDGKIHQLNFAGMMSWLSPDTGDPGEQKLLQNIRDPIASGKLDEAIKTLAVARKQYPHSARLGRIGISISDAYRRNIQSANAQRASSESIDYLLAMPEDSVATSITTLQALLTNQLVYAQDNETVQQASSMFDQAIKALTSYPDKQQTLRHAKILTLATIGQTSAAQSLLNQDLATARQQLAADTGNTNNRLALSKIYCVQSQVNGHLGQSRLKPLNDATNLLTHDWVVRHANSIDAVGQYLLTNRALIISARTSAPRTALKRVKEVLVTLRELRSSDRDPLVETLIDSEKHKLEMLLTGLNHDLNSR